MMRSAENVFSFIGSSLCKCIAGVNGISNGVATTLLCTVSAHIVILVSNVLIMASFSLFGVRSHVYKPRDEEIN